MPSPASDPRTAALVPVGYMAKRVATRPEWIEAPEVVDIYSVSNCISPSFADFIQGWRHNGFWHFDSPALIHEVAAAHAVDLQGAQFFYYEAYPLEFDEQARSWRPFGPSSGLEARVIAPQGKVLRGIDVVTHHSGNAPECSPLSCNGLAAQVPTNEHCLLASVDEACQLLERGRFDRTEPGPFRAVAVYTTPPHLGASVRRPPPRKARPAGGP